MRIIIAAVAPFALLGAAFVPATASADPSTVALSNNTPSFVASAQYLGATDASQTIDATVWLTLNNENQLQQQATAVNTPGNSSYHKFLSPAQVQATYDPSAQNLNAVTNYLQAKDLTVLGAAENNYYVKVEGTIGQLESAFHVDINNYSYHGQTYRSNASDPKVDTTNGMNGKIAAVTGLDDASYYSPLNLSHQSGTGETGPAYFTSQCGLSSIMQINVAPSSKATLTGFIPCGYGAKALETAYGVSSMCTVSRNQSISGLCGQGQTIVITDAYGSSSLQQDVNAYDQVNGLPALTIGQNLTVVSPPGIVNVKENTRQDPLGWQAEVTLDVENAHAIAPGANIVLVASPNNYSDLDEALNTVVVQHLGNIVSSSWATFEDVGNPAKFNRDERILQTGALEGIGFNFSSGDEGDDSVYFGGAFKTVEYPASSPFATAIGGTSLFLNADSSYLGESGWGTVLTKDYKCLTSSGTHSTLQTCNEFSQYTPPLDLGFVFGAGGGVSRLFAAPSWQTQAHVPSASLAASYGVTTAYRAVPDVSMLADPYTGSTIYITDHSIGGTSPVAETYGGTSLASPLFSGMMALVDQQRASQNKGPTGLAARDLYGLGTGPLHDITTVPPVAANGLYYQGSVSGSIFKVSFGQDGSLTTSLGWDDVTGVGSPNGQSFVTAVAAQP